MCYSPREVSLNPDDDNLTQLQYRLVAMERSQGWLARKLRVKPQTIGGWLRAEEPTPRSRQAQIALTLGIQAVDYFDRRGFAIRST